MGGVGWLRVPSFLANLQRMHLFAAAAAAAAVVLSSQPRLRRPCVGDPFLSIRKLARWPWHGSDPRLKLATKKPTRDC